MKLVIVRHGESEWNRLNLFTGWSDVDLSEQGIKEAKEAGKSIKEGDFDFDICYTSYLKRAINTLNIILREIDREWLPVVKSYKLNERHYGALQGLNKIDTARKYGEEQVKIWRRSYNVKPPKLSEESKFNPKLQQQYRKIRKNELPMGESLEDTINRVIPYFKNTIIKDMLIGERVLLVAHGNTIRSLVKYFEHLTEDEILEVNIPTGVPLVYEFDDDFNVVDKYYLGNKEDIAKKIDGVSNQGVLVNKDIRKMETV